MLVSHWRSLDCLSIDPELMIRMLLLGYRMGIRSERRLCEEIHINLAQRWFCMLDLADPVPAHSSFSKSRHGRFRERGLFRHLFEPVLQRRLEEGHVGGQPEDADTCCEQDAKSCCSADRPPQIFGRLLRNRLSALDSTVIRAHQQAAG